LDLPALGAEPISQGRFYHAEQELRFDLPFTAWSLSRRALDEALLKRADAAGARIERGTVVKHLSRVESGWKLRLNQRAVSANADSDSGLVNHVDLHASTVFLANGKQELRDWRRHLRGVSSNHFIGFKMHFRPDASQLPHWQGAVEIHLFDEGYAGLELIEGGRVNLCFLIEQPIYKACAGNWPRLLEWLAATSSHLRQRLAHLSPLWREPLAVAGIPYGFISSPEDTVDGLFRLGDQTAVIPSFAGDGIAIALHTAIIAARVHGAGGNSLGYHAQVRGDLQRPVRDAALVANLLSHAWGRNMAFRCARRWPELLKFMVHRTRVGLRTSR
jgi:flavin-dependent dehydrogenase